MALRVLLLTPVFYGIEKKIKTALEESDYEVIWIENKTLTLDYHGKNSKFKLLRRLFYLITSPHKRYLRREFKKIENPVFDILFSINAHVICPYLFRKLKSSNSKLFSVLYLWDSFSMFDWTRELKLFDRVYTFDRNDSADFKIGYKPIFFVRTDTPASCENDLFIVGKFSVNRLELIDKILSNPETSDLKCFMKIWPAYRIFPHNHLLYWLLKNIKFRNSWIEKYILNFEAVEGILKRNYLVTDSLKYEDVQNELLSSNVILDIPFKFQTGYSHRLIEAIAHGKKVITSNRNITSESFYDPAQIRLIDQGNPQIDIEWVKEKRHFPVNEYIEELELPLWLKSVINAEIA